MQNHNTKKPNKNESFIEIFLRTLSRLGNVLIITLGVMFFGIKKILFAFRKDQDEQTLYEFVKNLEEHLNESTNRFENRSTKRTYSAKKVVAKSKQVGLDKKQTVKSVKSNTSTISTKEIPIKTERKYNNKFKPKKSGLLRAVQVIATLIVAGALVFVIVISVKGLFGKKNSVKVNSEAENNSAQKILDMEIPLGLYSPLEYIFVEKKATGLLEKVYAEEIAKLKAYEEQLCLDEPIETTNEVESENTSEVTQEATNTAEVTPEPSSLAELDPEILIHLNDTNDVVAQIQEKLMDLHYLDADEPTTFYGPMTEFAMQLFQRSHGLMVDGVAGIDTITLLFSDKATQYLVHKGDKGWDIKQIQKRLEELGYLNGDYTKERYDDATYTAIREFQGRNKLDQDGVIGHNTTQVLYNGDAKPAKSYTVKTNDEPDSSSGGGTSNVSYNSNDASSFVAYAKSIMNKGYTYIWGGKGPPGMDCSGFVYYSLKQTGNGIGYMTSAAWAQSSYPTISSIHDVKAGDILCFQGHVAICIGGGKMIDSSSSQNAIRIANFETSTYWNNKWICGKRFFN